VSCLTNEQSEFYRHKTLASAIEIPIMRIHGNGKDASQSGYSERKRLSF